MEAALPLKLLALGDSYTCGTGVGEKERWPEQLAAALRASGIPAAPPRLVAGFGWRTGQLRKEAGLAGLEEDFGLVSLLAGVNDQYNGVTAESYAEEFEGLLGLALRCAGGEPGRVFVLSIPDYGYTPFFRRKREKVSAEIARFNAVNRGLAEKAGVKYFDITPITRLGLERPELVGPDGIHPTAAMYAMWVALIMEWPALRAWR